MIRNDVPHDIPSTPAPPRSIWSRRWATVLALIAILLLGAHFRTLNLHGWDEPSSRLHPDERFFVDVANSIRLPASFDEYIDSSRNPLNPRNRNKTFYVYGLLPQSLTRLTAVMLTPNQALPTTVPYTYSSQLQVHNNELDVPKLTFLHPILNPDGRNLTEYYEIFKVGRAWSVIFDLGSIILAFLIGSRLYGRRVGLLAALLLALSVLPIQLAHFFTVDAATGFFTLLSIYWVARIYQGGGWLNYALLGLSIGAAMACRVTMATIGLVAALAVLVHIWEQRRRNPQYRPSFLKFIALLALAGVLSVATFRLLQPDAFIGSYPNSELLKLDGPSALDEMLRGRGVFDIRPDPRYLENIKTIGLLVTGEAEFPPGHQWANRTPYWFPLRNIVVWGMGLPLGLAALLGWAVAGRQILWRARTTHFVPWIAVTLYFLWQGGILGMTMRYYALLYGLLAILAAWLLVEIRDGRWETKGAKRQKSLISHLQPWFRWGPLVVVVVGTLAWAYAFTRIYTEPHSRIAASRWIYENIPPGSSITSEEWDDALPLSVDGRNSLQYNLIQMKPYLEDDPTKYTGYLDQSGVQVLGFFDQLDQADYILLTSNRVYEGATRIPARFPALTRYYHSLFNGELGFKLIGDITSYPTLFGIPIPDQAAEEAFTVYDHPRVLVFQKTDAYSREKAEQLITGDIAFEEVFKLSARDTNRMPTALRLTEAQWPAFRDAGTWSRLFNPASISNQVPWLVWLLVLELIALATFALLFRLLPQLPDRGFALAKTLGLLLVAYVAWVFGSIGSWRGAPLLAFTPTTVWLCAGALIAAGGYVGWRNRFELAAFVRARRSALLTAQGLFLVAYLGFVVIRALNPDLWHPARGGEKPMDLAYLTAVVKSPSFPPYDPWFAGGYINYYYFGFVIIGALVHLTGIVPTTAYNLAVPTIFALTALGAWGAAYNLVALRGGSRGVGESGSRGEREWGRAGEGEKGRRGEGESGRGGDAETGGDKEIGKQGGAVPQHVIVSSRHLVILSKRERRAIVTGVVAAIFMLLLGNLAQAAWMLPGSVDATQPIVGSGGEALTSYAAQNEARGRFEWAFWDATRIVGIALQDSTINEFPFFTFLFGDLHAHMIALALTTTALGLMVALVRTGVRGQGSGVRGQRTDASWYHTVANLWQTYGPWFVALGALSLVIGALRAINTWDYPTYLGLSVLTLGLVAWDRTRRGATWQAALAGFVGNALALVVLSNLLFLPFNRFFATDYAGFERWQGTHTPIVEFLKINGLWLFLLISGTLAFYHRVRGANLLRTGTIGALAFGIVLVAFALQLDTPLLLVPLIGLALGLVVDVALHRTELPDDDDGLPEPALPDDQESAELRTSWTYEEVSSGKFQIPGYAELAAPLAARHTPTLPPAISLATLLPMLWALAALGLSLLVEVIVAKGDIGRMNTVFKIGMQSWTLFAVSSAIVTAWAWQQLTARTQRNPITMVIGWAWRVGVIALVVAALAYPLTATPARLADRFDTSIGPTLDGTAYMRAGNWAENGQTFDFNEDAAALDWMRANVSGTPIVLEAHTEGYRWGSRVSIYTGLPTLLGWPWHQTQQRSVAKVSTVLDSRKNLIQQLYTTATPDETLQKLQLYGVEYVIVGQLERALYGPDVAIKFDQLVSNGRLQLAYTSGATRIYQAPRPNEPPALLTTSLPVVAPALPPEKTSMLEQPVENLPVVDEYAWNPLAQSQPVAILLWLLASYALLILGLPLAVLVFGRSGVDGGFVWARLIGLLLLGYAVWLPVSARIWQYNLLGMLYGALLVLAMNVAILWWIGRGSGVRGRGSGAGGRGSGVGGQGSGVGNQGSGVRGQGSGVRGRRTGDKQSVLLEEIEQGATDNGQPTTDTIQNPKSKIQNLRVGLGWLWEHLLAHRKQILLVEGLFLGAFALMALLRAFNPDVWQPIWGGEKPFEFAFFNAILRSPVMPPYNPFFSDGTINYYYYGLYLVSLPVKATGVHPAVGFNLAIALLFAFMVAGSFALVRQLTGRVRYGLLGMAFVTLLGNLAAAFPVSWMRGDGLEPVRQALAQDPAQIGALLGDWFVKASRIIPNTINEFPYWSFLFADLHPHMIALPITVLMIAVVYQFFDERRMTNDERGVSSPAQPSSFVFRLPSFGLAALTLGALAVTNSWDFPTYALLLGGGLLGVAWLGQAPLLGQSHTWPLARRLALSVIVSGGIAALALLLYLPFFQNYQAMVSGIGLVHDNSPLSLYVLIYGLFLAIVIPTLFGAAWRVLLLRERRIRATVGIRSPEATGIVAERGVPTQLIGLGRILLAALAIILLFTVLRAVLTLGANAQSEFLRSLVAQAQQVPAPDLKLWLGAMIVVGALVLLMRRLRPATWFAIWMAVVAWAVSLGVELIFIRDHLAGGDWYRMNTVFKFGLQAWVLLAVAAAALLPALARGWRRLGVVAEGVGWAFVSCLIALSMVYPLFGTPSRLAYRFPETLGLTLDGLAFMDTATYTWEGVEINLRADAEAIRWLNENIEGTPIIVQTSMEFYRAYGVRVAANTGLPTIVSPLHESEQRDPAVVSARDADVTRLYSTVDLNEALEVLSKYRVGYVYVGPIERARYGDASVQKFDQMIGSYVNVVFRNQSVTIYQVNPGVYGFSAATLAPPIQAVTQPVNVAPPPDFDALISAHESDPTAAGPAFALAQAYAAQGQYDDAAEALRPAAEANPQDVPLHHLWGDILRDAGRVEEAEAAYRHAAEVSGMAANYNKLGVELAKMGLPDRAEAAFKEGLALDPTEVNAYYYLGELFEQRGDRAQAREQFEQYLSRAPADGTFRDLAAQALERLE
jgi:YYY domain-containing protein